MLPTQSIRVKTIGADNLLVKNIWRCQMIHSIHFIELTLSIEMAQFNKLLKYASQYYSIQRLRSDKYVYADESLVSRGIGIEYHNKKKKKIKIIVTPSNLLDHDTSSGLWNPTVKNTARFLKELKSQIDDYFNYEYSLNDFKLSCIGFTVDVRFSDKDMVADYIKAFHNIGKVKNFQAIKYGRLNSGMDKSHAFILVGKSNGIAFMVYSKKAKINHFDNEEVWNSLRLKQTKGVLRIDVVLTTQKAIRAMTSEGETIKRITDLFRKAVNIFGEYTMRVIPYGDFYKIDKARRIVEEKVANRTMRSKMLRLLELVPTKKSLLLAQKELNDRSTEKIMTEFREINLSPVTIGRRQEFDYLENFYNHIFSQ
jgi:hypothetical protein